MSDTPETDENMVAWDRANRPGCDADFARKLERERDEARKERDEWIEIVRQMNANRESGGRVVLDSLTVERPTFPQIVTSAHSPIGFSQTDKSNNPE